MAIFPTFGFVEFFDQSLGQAFSFLGLTDLYTVIQMLFKVFTDTYLPRINDFGMVRHLWMPEPYVEGYSPLRYSVTTSPTFLPVWLDHFLLKKSLFKRWVYATMVVYQSMDCSSSFILSKINKFKI
jgi:hypothetical protein